jgi:hypothetical protein
LTVKFRNASFEARNECIGQREADVSKRACSNFEITRNRLRHQARQLMVLRDRIIGHEFSDIRLLGGA